MNDLSKVRKHQSFFYVSGQGDSILIATVVATEDPGINGVLCKINTIHFAGSTITSQVSDTIVSFPSEITLLDDNPINPVKPGHFMGTLSTSSLGRYPHPAYLGSALMQNSGYLFSSVPEEFHSQDLHVPIYNIQQLVGYISYIVEGIDTKVFISDVPNSQGNILTEAAAQAMRK